MARPVLVLAAAAIPCALFSTNHLSAQVGKPPDLAATRVLATRLATSYEKFVSGAQACDVAEANTVSKKIWAAALGCRASSSLVFHAGFKLAALTSAAAIPGARVVATFEVTRVVGPASLEVSSLPSWRGVKRLRITQPGTYTLRSDPFTVEADRPHNAQAEVRLGMEGCQEICAVVMKVSEIKWEF